MEVFRGSRPQFHKMAMEDEDVPEAYRQVCPPPFKRTASTQQESAAMHQQPRSA